MTPDMNSCSGAALPAEAARHLIDRARDGELVDLAVVSAMDLCVLRGPGHPAPDKRVTRAWNQLGGRQRDKAAAAVMESLLNRGLLVDEGVQTGARPRSGCYAPGPELSLVLAARIHPSFVVSTGAEGQDLRGLRLLALGNEAGPAREFVAEAPAALPPDRAAAFPGHRKLGPLGWIYRYVLVSREQAAEVLARWTISVPARPGGYLMSVCRPARDGSSGSRIRIRAQGDGTCVQVDGPGPQDRAGYDLAGLQAAMLRLITEPSR